MPRILTAGALLAALMFAAPTQAAVIATLSFTNPTGVVGASDSVPVWLTLTLDAASDALITDGSGEVTSGLTDDDIIAAGGDPDLVTRTGVNVFYQCGGTFGGLCGGDYAFDFNYGAASLIGAQNLNLQPGTSTQFLFGAFSPVGGSAAPGTYTFFNAGFEFFFSQPGLGDHDGGDITIAQTCVSQEPACGFSRTVLAAPGGAVPEPGAWALMILGFGGAGAALRRRRSTVAA